MLISIASFCALDPLLSSKLAAFSLLIPSTNAHNTNCSLATRQNARPGCFFFQGRAKFAISARRNSRVNDESFLDMYGADEDDDEDDDEEAFVPFPSMTRWFENKPPGFGEGKEYDTSVEDKLFEEMQQSRMAQLANINKLKNIPVKVNSKKELQTKRATDVVSGAIRVRVSNLPKKRNIHRDLQLAFHGFPGILNISPAVAANKKTRDPICKAFAFVDLAYEVDANRFIQTYSRKSITFGKVQKHIKCEIMHPKDFSSPTGDHSVVDTNTFNQEGSIKMEENPDANPDVRDYMHTSEVLTGVRENHDAGLDIGEFSLNSFQTSASEEDSVGLSDIPFVSQTWEEIEEGIAESDFSELNQNTVAGPSVVNKTDSISSSNLQQHSRKDKKNMRSKGKPGTVPKLIVPGSAKRLKIKEKAVLTGVLAKYGKKTLAAS